MSSIYFKDRTVTYNQFLDDVARKVAHLVSKDLRKELAQEPEMVTTEEAARILGVSAGHMRRIKDRFPYIKSGEGKQGHLLFVRKALITTYSQ